MNPLEELKAACRARVRRLVAEGRLREADGVSRDCAERLWRLASDELRERAPAVVEAATGGLGYGSESPFDPAQMVVAGTVIAWPEAVRDGSRVVEIGTGVGRTCYVIHYAAKPSEYVTIDVSLEVLAIALHANPSPSFADCLRGDDVVILYGDAVDLLPLLPSASFDHAVHDGGPNPLRNPRLYSRTVFAQLARILRPCGTVSVFAGRSREGRRMVYEGLASAGFTGIHAVSFPTAPTFVYRARKPCTREDKA